MNRKGRHPKTIVKCSMNKKGLLKIKADSLKTVLASLPTFCFSNAVRQKQNAVFQCEKKRRLLIKNSFTESLF